jgi:hypothetical protein
MYRRSMAVLIAGIFLSIPFSVRAQEIGVLRLMSEKGVSDIGSSGTNNGNNSSSEAMVDQIKVQQLEINDLRDRIKKLESMLETVSTNQPASSTTPAVSKTSGISPAPAGGAPIPAPQSSRQFALRSPTTSRELLPDIGQIGAEVGFFVGGSQNPFKSNDGFFTGGFIDLPLKKIKGGKLSYEIMIGAQRTISTVQTTSGVIALVNSALNNALGTPPGVSNLLGPLPITNKIKERLTVLTVVPVSFKYTATVLDNYNIRPYAIVGLGAYVGLSSQQLVDFDAQKVINNAAIANLVNTLLNGPQVGGLIPIAPELRERGLSAGQGDFRFGVNFGGGVELRISPRFSIGFDYRLNKIEGRNSMFSTFSAKPTIHF